MTSLLHAANMYLHYRGGKHVGLAGLIGVIVAIIVIIIWPNYIQPIINFIGINKVAENMGIVVDGFGGGAATAYNVFIIYFFFCIAFSLVVGLGLLAYVYGSIVLRTKFGAVLVGVLLFIPLSPILIWFAIAMFIEKEKDQKRANENPKVYSEEQMLKKNIDIIDYLIRSTEKDGETNQLRKVDVLRYLHRIPSTTESYFSLGITYEREVILLFPRPFGIMLYGKRNTLIGVPLSFEKFIPIQHDRYGMNTNSPQRFYIKPEDKIKHWNVEEVETFIYPEKIYDIQLLLKDFNESELYKKYVHRACNQYKHHKEQSHDLNNNAGNTSNVISIQDYTY